MTAGNVTLWLVQAPGHPDAARHVGDLAVAGVRADSNTPKGIRIALKTTFSQPFLAAHSPARWIGLRIEVVSQKRDQRIYGRIALDFNDRSHNPGMPAFEVPGRDVEWNWCLLPEDLERIERERGDSAGSPLNFNILAAGALQVGTDVFPVQGHGHLQFAVSDWEAHLKVLGYNLPPSTAELVGLAALDHPSWEEAVRRLAPARKEIRAGEGRDALVTCLGQFERVVTAPYSRESWNGLFDVPGQKEDGMVSMLAGHCTYLNKVGHHRSREERDQEGGLLEMPVDQWEAELAVATSQFLLAYALRAPKRKRT